MVGVIPDSPAATGPDPVQPGDLIIRINGDPVAQWDLRRFDQLVASARTITFTFLKGTEEKSKTLAVFDLVP